VRFAICNELFEGWTFRRMAECVAATGYDGIEVAPYTLAARVDEISPATRREQAAIARDLGLAITGLHWLLAQPPGLQLLAAEAATRIRTIDHLRGLVDLCADLGGRILVFGSPRQRCRPDAVAPGLAGSWATEAFRQVGDAAASRGVTLCLEALPADLTNFLTTNAEVASFVDAVAHPCVRMMVDVKSMSSEALPIPENLRTWAGRFDHVHANDANGRGPGFGAVDFRPILKTLQDQRYERFVSVEVFDFTGGPELIAARSLEYLHACRAAARS
jgi:sugar phosphate isomerase/epimerase